MKPLPEVHHPSHSDLIRDTSSKTVIYVGMAGERAGSGRPTGLWGRLGVYRSGKGAVSGFGEAVLDRALGNEEFVSAQLASLRACGPMRTKDWAREAIAWLSPELSWSVCADRASALKLEDLVEKILGVHGLWNKVSTKRRSLPPVL